MSKKESKLSSKAIKLLAAIRELKRYGDMASSDGIIHLLNGSKEAEEYCRLDTYGCLLSLKSKQGKILINSLVKKGYISLYLDEDENESYLVLEEKSLEISDAYLASPKPKKEKVEDNKKEFIKIKGERR